MRCHYLSDLHLEAQSFRSVLPTGDLLIIAGDLCHACCLDPARADKYHTDQRSRVLRFLDAARSNFAHVLLVAGNHEFCGSTFDDVPAQLSNHMPGVTVLDNETVEIGGVRFFGSTFWTDFDGRSPTAMDTVRRRMGEFFFVKMRVPDPGIRRGRFQPEDALRAHDTARASLLRRSLLTRRRSSSSRIMRRAFSASIRYSRATDWMPPTQATSTI